MTPDPASVLLTGIWIVVTALGVICALRSGYRSALRGDGLYHSCVWAWCTVTKRTLLLFLIFGLAAAAASPFSDDPLRTFLAILSFAPVLALAILTYFLPVAGVAGFIGYNFGARQRACRDLLNPAPSSGRAPS